MYSEDFYIARERWISRFLADPETRSPDAVRSVAVKLAFMATPRRPFAWPSAETLASMTAFSSNAIERAIAALHELPDYFKIESGRKRKSRNRHNGSNTYHLVFSIYDYPEDTDRPSEMAAGRHTPGSGGTSTPGSGGIHPPDAGDESRRDRGPANAPAPALRAPASAPAEFKPEGTPEEEEAKVRVLDRLAWSLEEVERVRLEYIEAYGHDGPEGLEAFVCEEMAPEARLHFLAAVAVAEASKYSDPEEVEEELDLSAAYTKARHMAPADYATIATKSWAEVSETLVKI